MNVHSSQGAVGGPTKRGVVDTLFKARSTECVSAATRVRQVSTEEMHAITEQSDAWMHAVAKFSCAVHMPFGREPMTCRVVWEPSHGWSVVSDLIYFVDLRPASPQRRRRVSLICIRHRRRCRGVADGSSQLALGIAERSFYAVIAMQGEASPK